MPYIFFILSLCHNGDSSTLCLLALHLIMDIIAIISKINLSNDICTVHPVTVQSEKKLFIICIYGIVLHSCACAIDAFLNSVM